MKDNEQGAWPIGTHVINVPVNLLPAEPAYFDGEMYGVCPAAS